MSSSSRRRAKNRKKDKKKQDQSNWRTVATADRHELYELSVQDTGAEIDFVDQVWRQKRRRLASRIREDFAGTGASSMEWVKRRKDNTAIAVDLDEEVQAWGLTRCESRLTEDERARLTYRTADVTKPIEDGVDSVFAMNFSYYTFKTREDLREYFEAARAALVEDGLFFLDAYGGSESFSELEEERDLDGFTYVWDQHIYHPVTGYAENHIHFRFPDGTEMDRAFSYTWRLWTLAEIQELLDEAGFKRITVYWEGTDHETGEGDGEFRPTECGEACEGWIAYVVAEP